MSEESGVYDAGERLWFFDQKNLRARRECMALEIARAVVGNDRLLRQIDYDTQAVARFAVDVTDGLMMELCGRGK